MYKQSSSNLLHQIAQTTNPTTLQHAVMTLADGICSDEQKILSKIQSTIKTILESPDKKELSKQLTEELCKYQQLNAVQNGDYIKSTVYKEDQQYVESVRNQLVTENNAQTLTEKMLIDLATSAYFRSMYSNRIYNYIIQNDDHTITWDSQKRINLTKELGKQANNASQQFQTLIAYLHEFKQPSIKVNIQTENAYIAHNQQINHSS